MRNSTSQFLENAHIVFLYNLIPYERCPTSPKKIQKIIFVLSKISNNYVEKKGNLKFLRYYGKGLRNFECNFGSSHLSPSYESVITETVAFF